MQRRIQPRRPPQHLLRRSPNVALLASSQLAVAGIATAWLLGQHSAHSAPALVGSRSHIAFVQARPGQCLTWPKSSPDQLSIVDCARDHRFEVAAALDATADARGADLEADQQHCQAAVGHYLGARYDPDGRFTAGVLWSPADGPVPAGRQRTLCGLQLPGPASEQLTFRGQVAELDQAKVWPPGTCLGIDAVTNQSSDIPVDCSTPHAVEVTGAVTVASSSTPPADTDQEAFTGHSCAPATDAYLSPVALSQTGLTLAHASLTPASWTAGTRQVACRIGAPAETGGWKTLVGSAKGALRINGQIPQPEAVSTPGPTTPTAGGTQVSGRHGQLAAPSRQPAAVNPPDADNPDQALGPGPGPVEGQPPATAPDGPPPAGASDGPPAPPPPAEVPAAPPPAAPPADIAPAAAAGGAPGA